MSRESVRQQDIRRIEQQWYNMTITSDPMFGLVMQNKAICLNLIQRALPELKINKIKQITTQKEVATLAVDRSVRYDVYAEDDHQRIYVVEMQMKNEHNIPSRLRYYQEQIDNDLLEPGADYNKLAHYPTYVIMFCNFDYFGRGWAKYRFDCTCVEDRQLKLGDNRTVVIFNAKAKQFNGNEQIRGFLQLMRNQVVPDDLLVQQVQKEVQAVKNNPERRRGYMKFELDLMDARRAGKNEGKEEAVQNYINFSYKQHLDDQQIIQGIGEILDIPKEKAAEYFAKYTNQ
ncbi:Rpn family recombination-promoting nuclease/putative transposase [Limosilactobacillus sp. STM2_1]|uniref:Rpn family recombination-promoting nuclease/putative transposase n=1 Tax=Limosilactobacillus rudii TaxID=2759755 RepID=A0A7W3UN56_9LACO|nr:Rpn family recombination-promoting nuclease/putative transposase [Limosilactobacillus rudii]MBB1078738.1 Rpn family recombination-promoting nuclease/putative transposase [Limosilactobacillus rudii]MBB1098170.1 Rpn family recombination-promoting nuclease/putative transposase [Limosilactobacillus rudii]MCD7135242.1 Rpn family recombination-promoting nuclease/putative transposase [Limosilactobacillus rudii]